MKGAKCLLVGSRSGAKGFTILELTISAAIFAVVGYVLLQANKMGHDSQSNVTAAIERSESLRAARDSIVDEFKMATESRVTVTTLADGNHELTFQMPITVAGADSWGVYDRSFGATEDDQNKADWSIRYTVQGFVHDGEDTLGLVRQVLDDKGEVQSQEPVVHGLSKDATSAGFQVIQTGAMWEIHVNKMGYGHGTDGEGTTFHVRARN